MTTISRRSLFTGAGLGLLAAAAAPAVAAEAATPEPAPVAGAAAAGRLSIEGLVPRAPRASLGPRPRWNGRAVRGLQATTGLVYAGLKTDAYGAIGGNWATGVSSAQATFEAWIRTTATAAQTILSGDGNPDGSPNFSVNGSAPGVSGDMLTLAWSSASASAIVNSPGGLTLTDGQWHHVAVTCQGTSAQFYADGVNVGSGVIEGSIPAAGNLRVGGGPADGSTVGFIGEIWNARVWSKPRDTTPLDDSRWEVLTAQAGLTASIAFSAGNGGIGQLTNAVDNTTAPVSTDALVTPTDLPNPTFGIYNEGQGDAQTDGAFTGFDGLNSNALTLEAWWRPDLTNGGGTTPQILFGMGYAGAEGFSVSYLGDDEIGLAWNSVSAATSDGRVLSDGAWHHLAVVFDSGTLTFYKDGVGSGPGVQVTSGNPLSVQPFLTFGGNGSGQGGLIGQLYDLRVWNTARSAAEIASFRYAELVGDEAGLLSLIQGTSAGTVVDVVNPNFDIEYREMTFGGTVGPVPTLPQEVWTYSMDGYAPVGPLRTGNGVVLCVDNQVSTVFALDVQTDQVVWTGALPPTNGTTSVVPAALGTNGNLVFIGLSNTIGEASGTSIYAVNATTGALAWSGPSPLAGQTFLTRPVVLGGYLWVGTSADNNGPATPSLYSLDPAGGAEYVSGPLGGPATSMTTPVADTTSLYVTTSGDSSATVFSHALNSLTVNWHTTLQAPVSCDPVLAGSTLYVVAGGTVYAIATSTGAVSWSLPLGTADVVSQPAVVGNTLCVADKNGMLYAVDTVGQALSWSVATGSAVTTDIVAVDGVLYFANQGDGAATGPAFLAVDTNSQGNAVLSYEVPDGDTILFSSAGAIDTGVVYFYSASNVYAVNMATAVREVEVATQLIVENYDPTQTAPVPSAGNPLGTDTSYRVIVTLRDENGMARPSQAVNISTVPGSALTIVNQGGTTPLTVDETGQWFETDSTGVLSLAVSAFDPSVTTTMPDGTTTRTPLVACPPVLLWSPFLPTDEIIVIHPDHESLATLASVPGTDPGNGSPSLQTANGYNGGALMTSSTASTPGALDQVAMTVRNTLGAVTSTPPTTVARSRAPRTRVRAIGPQVATAIVNPSAAAATTTRPYVAGEIPVFTATFGADGSVVFKPKPASTSFSSADVGSIWGDIKHFTSNVVHGAEHVASVAWTAVDNTVTAVIGTIENGLTSLYNLTITTLEDAATVVVGFLKTVVNDISQVVEWLSYLFDWNAILANHTTIADAVTGSSGSLAALTSWLGGPGSGQLGPQLASLGGSASMNLASSGTASGGTDMRSLNASYGNPSTVWNQGGGNNAVSCTWLQQKTNENLGGASLSSTRTTSVGATDSVTAFRQAVDQAVASDFGNLPGEFQTALNALVDNFKDPSTLLSTGISDLLGVVGTVAADSLKLLSAVEGPLLTLLQNGLDQVTAAAATQLDIPFVSALYQKVVGSPLTAIDLGCLIAAVPATVVLGAVTGSTTPPSPSVTPSQPPAAGVGASSIDPTSLLFGVAGLAISAFAVGLDTFTLDLALNDLSDDEENNGLDELDLAIDALAYGLGLAAAITAGGMDGGDWVFWAASAMPIAVSAIDLYNSDDVTGLIVVEQDTGIGVFLAVLAGCYAAIDPPVYFGPTDAPGLSLAANLLSDASLIVEVLAVLLDPQTYGQAVLAGKVVLGLAGAGCALAGTLGELYQ